MDIQEYDERLCDTFESLHHTKDSSVWPLVPPPQYTQVAVVAKWALCMNLEANTKEGSNKEVLLAVFTGYLTLVLYNIASFEVRD